MSFMEEVNKGLLRWDGEKQCWVYTDTGEPYQEGRSPANPGEIIQPRLLKSLVNQTLTDLSTKEKIAPLKVRWVAELYDQKPSISVSYLPEPMGGPLIKFPVWLELLLIQRYERFEPFVRNLVAHEFKHYLQDVSPYEVLKPKEERELEAEEYAAQYSGMNPFKFLYAVKDAKRLVEEKFRAGARVST